MRIESVEDDGTPHPGHRWTARALVHARGSGPDEEDTR